MNHNIPISTVAALLALVAASGAAHARSASEDIGVILGTLQHSRVEYSPNGRACSAWCGLTRIDECATTCA